MDQTFITRAKSAYEIRMSADPRYQEAKRIHDACMAQYRQRMAASKPQPRHLHVVAHAGAAPQPTFQYATDELVAKVQAERHAREKVEAQARELDEAYAEIVRQFISPKPAALAIRAIKE